MSTIVCATRGGEGSRAVQREAIRFAKEGNKPLAFLYVLDMSPLGNLEPSLLEAVRSELTWLGKALVNAAKQRARAQDIDAQVVIREGNLEEEICRFLKESRASMLLLGAPRGTTPIFGDDAVEQFALNIHKETGVRVEVVKPELMTIDGQHELLSGGRTKSFSASTDVLPAKTADGP